MAPGQGAQGRQLAGAPAAGGPGLQAPRCEQRRGLHQARAAGERRSELSARAHRPAHPRPRPRPAQRPGSPTFDPDLCRGVPTSRTRPLPSPTEAFWHPRPRRGEQGAEPGRAPPPLTCPSLASPAARRRRRRRRGCFKGRPGRCARPRPAASGLPRRPRRWRARAAPGGAGAGFGEAAAGACECGALCGGGAGTAVRAAPARARSATPRLGTRAGSAGRGQSLTAPRSAQGPAPASRSPSRWRRVGTPETLGSSASHLVDPGF